MWCRPILVAAIALAIPVAAAAAQTAVTAPIKTLSAAEAREDVQRLRFTIEHAHGNAYRYISKPELDAAFDRLEGSINGSISDLDLFRRVAPVVSLVRDSHTAIRPPEALRHFFSNNARRVFPLDLLFVGRSPLVEANLSDRPSIPAGWELVSIDGRPIADVTETITAPVAVDGTNRAAKLTRLNESFWYLYGLAYGPSDKYSVVVRDPQTGRQLNAVLAGVPPRRIAARRRPPAELASQRLQFLGDDVALLTLDELSGDQTGEFLDRSFEAISKKQIRDLIIDLRRCPGGRDTYNHRLLSYLSPVPFRLYSARTFRVRDYRDLKFVDYEVDDFLSPEQVALLPAHKRAAPLKTMGLGELLRFMLSSDDADAIYRPARANRFSGRFYLLVSAASASSAAEIAALTHHLGLATIIGEEPNGAYQGVTAEAVPMLTLPNSRIGIGIPLVANRNAVVPGIFHGRGAPPAFPVSETISDAIAGRDTVLLFAQDLIRRRRNPS